MHSIRRAALLVLTLASLSALADKQWQPSNPNINMVMAPLSVSDGPHLLDVAQDAGFKYSVIAGYSPGPKSAGVLEFRANSYTTAGYVLEVDPKGYPIISVNHGVDLTVAGFSVPVGTVLDGGSTQALKIDGGSYLIELIADGDVFTVKDLNNSGALALSVADPLMNTYVQNLDDPDSWAYGQAPAIWVGATGGGTWQVAVSQSDNPSNPPLGVAAVVLPDVDHDNATDLVLGVPDSLVNHFDVPQPGSCEMDFDFSPMFQPNDGENFGKVTIHRDRIDINSNAVNDYEVHLFQDRVELHKGYDGGTELLVERDLGDGGLSQNSQLPLQIAAYDGPGGTVTINVNLTDMNLNHPKVDLTPQTNVETVFANGWESLQGKTFPQDGTYVNLVQNLISWTDSPHGSPDGGPSDPMGWPIYTAGYRFGIYTAQHAVNCWDNFVLINH